MEAEILAQIEGVFRERIKRKILASTAFEFPRVSPCVWLTQHRYVYGVRGYLGDPIRLDVKDGSVDEFWSQPDEWCGELVPIPKKDTSEEDGVWLMALVLSAERSELRIFDGEKLNAPAVARIALPHVVPFDFHGNWLPKKGNDNFP